MSGTRMRYWHDACLFIFAAALYAPSLRYGFVGDDLIYFIGNQHITSFDVRTILLSGAIGADYLPLRDLSFALDYLLWGADPFGFHLTNVVLFGVTVLCVKRLFAELNAFLTGQEREKGEIPAFLAALVFSIHPNHREVVYAIFNRGALLTVLFSILSFLLFLRFLRGRDNRYRSYAAALACYVFALMSREYSIVLPIALLLLISFEDRARRMAHAIHTLPFFFFAALFYVLYRTVAIAANFITPSSEPFLAESISKTAVAVKIALFYIVRMVTTLGEFSFDDSTAFALVSVLIVAGLLVASWYKRPAYPQLLFGMLFYLISLIPVLNFFKTLPVVAYRYSFLPCVGLFFILMAIPYEGGKRFFSAFCVIFTLLWTLTTIPVTYYWKDNISFWEEMAAQAKMPYVYMQLGYAYFTGEQYEKALEAMSKVRPFPREARFHVTVGKACSKLENYECAIQALETAINLGVRDASVSLELTSAYLAVGRPGQRGEIF